MILEVIRVLNDWRSKIGPAWLEQIDLAAIVLTGMQPMVALTLVEMGREIIGMETALDLEAGVARLKNLILARGTGGFGAVKLTGLQDERDFDG